MKKHNWAIFVGINLIIAVIVSLVVRSTQEHSTRNLMVLPTPAVSGVVIPVHLDPPAFEEVYDIHIYVNTDHWYSWALIDMKSGILVGSENWSEPNYMMSMGKSWIAADYLSLHPNPNASTLSRLSAMIVDSENQAASEYFGGQASWDRFIKACGLTDLKTVSYSWSTTGMSARDAARYGYCVYSGYATTPEWTSWIVDKMRHVRGAGDFGPRALFADRTSVATKNGWFMLQGKWYINCLAVTDEWSMSILQRWPYSGESYQKAISEAELVCNSIAKQVLRLS